MKLKNILVLQFKKAATGTTLIYASGILLTLLSQIIITNALGAAQYSIYYYALTWILVLSIFSKFGIDYLILRLIPKYRAHSEWGLFRGLLLWSKNTTLTISVLVAILLFAVIFLLGHLEQELKNTFYIACLTIPIMTLIYLRYSLLKSLKHPQLSLLPELIISPVLLSLMILATEHLTNVINSASLTMWYYLFTLILSSLLGYLWLKKRIPEPVNQNAPVYQSNYWLQITYPLFTITLLHQLLNNTDTILLGMINGTDKVGIYGIASKISLAISFPLMVANVLFTPLISEYHSTEQIEKLQQLLLKGMRLVIIFSFFILILVIFARENILAIFGAEFIQGESSLMILSIGQFVNALLGPVGFLLSQTLYEKTVMKTLLFVTLMNIILNIVLIPQYGLEGAALATSFSIISLNLVLYFKVKKFLGIDASGLFKSRKI